MYHIFRKPMLIMAVRIVGDVYLAEDAVQQTFERLLIYHESFDKVREGYEWPYIKTILIRVSKELLRRKERVIPIDELELQTRFSCLLYHISAEEEALKAYSLQADIRRLPLKYSETLELHYLHDYSYEEIAKMRHLKPATVRKRAQRGRNMMAVKLK